MQTYTDFVSFKKSKKSIKIVNVEGESLPNF